MRHFVFRWWMLIPVYIGALIGATLYEKKKIVDPATLSVAAARTEWESKKSECKGEEDKYQGYLDAQVSEAKKLCNGYNAFSTIRETMPQLYDYKGKIAKYQKPEDGLIEWYNIWLNGTWVKELNKWIDGFQLGKWKDGQYLGKLKDPVKVYDKNDLANSIKKDDSMGYDETYSSVHVLKYKFPEQTIIARGFPDLLSQLRTKTGYGYFPMIITLPSAIDLKINPKDRYDPKRPKLTLTYNATGYCMTRGWDPMSTGDAAAKITEATELINKSLAGELKTTPHRDKFDNGLPPNVLLYFNEQTGLTP